MGVALPLPISFLTKANQEKIVSSFISEQSSLFLTMVYLANYREHTALYTI